MNFEVIALGAEIASGLGVIAFWVIRGFWKTDVRFTGIEKDISAIKDALETISERPRRVIRMGNAVGPDYGNL